MYTKISARKSYKARRITCLRNPSKEPNHKQLSCSNLLSSVDDELQDLERATRSLHNRIVILKDEIRTQNQILATNAAKSERHASRNHSWENTRHLNHDQLDLIATVNTSELEIQNLINEKSQPEYKRSWSKLYACQGRTIRSWIQKDTELDYVKYNKELQKREEDFMRYLLKETTLYEHLIVTLKTCELEILKLLNEKSNLEYDVWCRYNVIGYKDCQIKDTEIGRLQKLTKSLEQKNFKLIEEANKSNKRYNGKTTVISTLQKQVKNLTTDQKVQSAKAKTYESNIIELNKQVEQLKMMITTQRTRAIQNPETECRICIEDVCLITQH